MSSNAKRNVANNDLTSVVDSTSDYTDFNMLDEEDGISNHKNNCDDIQDNSILAILLALAHRKSVELVKKDKNESLESILERQQGYIRSEIFQDACRDGINLSFTAQANIGTATGFCHVAFISTNAFSLRTLWSSKSILVTGFSDILSAKAATIVRGHLGEWLRKT